MKVYLNKETAQVKIVEENGINGLELSPEQIEIELSKRGFTQIGIIEGDIDYISPSLTIQNKKEWFIFQKNHPKTIEYRLKTLEAIVKGLKNE